MIVLKVVIQILVKIHDFLFGYPGEPEYQEESNLMESSDDNKSTFYNEKENNLNSNRVKNHHSCKSLHCTAMPTSIECKCYKELKDLICDQS